MEWASCDTKCKKNNQGEILMNKIMDTKKDAAPTKTTSKSKNFYNNLKLRG